MTNPSPSQEPVRVTFLGASRTVTGSKYLIEHKKSSFLIDAGLFQGGKELRLRNWAKFPVDVSQIGAVVLTHAHIDHTGYLPRLVNQGFRGPIYCTKATADLTRILLLDSAHLQEEEARYADRAGSSKHHPALPLYTTADAQRALELLTVIPRGAPTELLPGVRVKPVLAGHILGATSLGIEVGGRRLCFSGDIGRYGVPILPDPEGLEMGDLLVMESTYADRDHPHTDPEEELLRVVQDSLHRHGPVIFPAFALGRTQTILYYLAKLEREGRLEPLPVFVDSPMAADSSDVYRNNPSDFDAEMLDRIGERHNPLRTLRTKFCRTVEESKAINDVTGPRIIISASGMVTGGRILHHLRRWLPNPNATVVFVGFQGEGTRGAIIQSRAEDVKIFGEYVPIRAHIETLSSLSAHAGRGELLRWAKSGTGAPSRVKVVHGEPKQTELLAATLREELGWNASPAEHLETIEV